MENKIEYIRETPEWAVFEYGGRAFAFIARFSAIVELDRAAALNGAGGRSISAGLSAALDGLSAGLSNIQAFNGNDENGAPVSNADLVRLDAAKPVTVSAINLNLTPRCNLACVYCYAKGGDYERLDSEMSLETITRALEEAMPHIDTTRGLRFEFFGGEPLLNEKTISGVLEWERGRSFGGRPVTNRISSNLTEYSPSIEKLFDAGDFILSISIDGNRRTQDSQRPYRSGEGSFDDIVANVRRVKNALPRLPVVARMTVLENPAGLLEEIEGLVSMNIFDYCSIYCAAMDDRGSGELRMSDEFARAYFAMAENYGRLLTMPGNIFKGCLELNRYICHILEGTCATNHCRAGAGYFSLSPDGSVHPCHRLIGKPEFAIKGGLAAAKTAPSFWRETVDARNTCRDCVIRYFCGGGCKQEALISTGDPLGVSAKGCGFSRLLFDSALAAVISMPPEAAEKVRASCGRLVEMFVLCGQNVSKNGREKAAPAIEAALSKFMVRR